MPIFLPPISKAKNNLGAIDLFSYRKKYKNTVLVDKSSPNRPPVVGSADFWYDRNLYGKIDRKGNIIIPKESLFRTLKTRNSKTFYTLDFVALAFNQMINELEYNFTQNLIPNQKTVFRALSPTKAWESVYQPYHRYMVGLFDRFAPYLKEQQIESRIRNFEDFVEEFFIFVRNSVTMYGSPITFSGFVSSPIAPPHCSGLIIDIANLRPADDFPKKSIFVDDINFDIYKNAANKFGFAIDRNIPWRLAANLNSESMQVFMSQPVFNTDYKYSPKNLFDKYYLKTFILDYGLLEQYMYQMYESLLQGASKFEEDDFYVCKNNIGKLFSRTITRKELPADDKANTYNYKNYWLEVVFRFRLLELNHDLNEEDINYHIKKAKQFYEARTPNHAYKYLHKITKSFFLHQYNLSRGIMAGSYKKPIRNIVVTSVGKNRVSFKGY